MYEYQEALARERSAELLRRSAQRQLGEQLAASRRWRRRAERARRSAESLESHVAAGRSEYELAGR